MKKLIMGTAIVLSLGACGRGKQGVQGAPGQSGSAGHNAVVSIVNVAPTCIAGGSIILAGTDLNDNGLLDSDEVTSSTSVCNGVDGATGATGNDGHNSIMDFISETDGGGISCSTGGITVLAGTDVNDNAILELSEVKQSKDVCNGLRGAAGLNGQDAPANPFAVTGFEDPCGDAPGIFDEIFLRLSNGKLVASFSANASGLNTRFAELVPGSYVTTDGDSCSFTVNSSLDIVNESKHW